MHEDSSDVGDSKVIHPRDASYSDRLQLESILSAQHPQTDAHDEMLFIIQHQTTELWLKMIIYELTEVRKNLGENDLQPAFKTLSRVARIFDQLNGAWDVLRTMTPSDYTKFRETLGTASGFQSHQYRMVEFLLGNRNTDFLKVHDQSPRAYELLKAELERPSLYHDSVRLLYLTIDGPNAKPPTPELRKPHESNDEIQQRWKIVYEDISKYWRLYELAEKLVDLEDYFRRWRFNHVTTVERVIGYKHGTGGTEGVPYLREKLNVVLFPELWNVRGDL